MSTIGNLSSASKKISLSDLTNPAAQMGYSVDAEHSGLHAHASSNARIGKGVENIHTGHKSPLP
jgi:hypothetical protein